MKKLFVSIILLLASKTYALDLEENVKNYEKSADWASFMIADPYFGKVIATRAVTEDLRTDASLALTYPTNGKCKLMPMDIIIKLDNPIIDETSTSIYGNIQIDDQPAQQVEALLQNEPNSEFVFITISKANIDTKLKNAKTMTANFKGYGVINFSLKGAKKSIENAKSSCQEFSF